MRIAALIFIVLTLAANFIYNNITSLVVAMLSYPFFLWVLLKRKKNTASHRRGHPAVKDPLPTENRSEK